MNPSKRFYGVDIIDQESSNFSGAKITKSRKGIKLTDNNGVISILDDTGQGSSKDSRLTEHYKFYKEVKFSD